MSKQSSIPSSNVKSSNNSCVSAYHLVATKHGYIYWYRHLVSQQYIIVGNNIYDTPILLLLIETYDDNTYNNESYPDNKIDHTNLENSATITTTNITINSSVIIKTKKQK